MISKSSIKLIQSLKLKKFRQKYDLFIAEGLKTVTTMLASGRYEVDALYATQDCIENVKVHNNDFVVVEAEVLSKASHKKSRADVLAIFRLPSDVDKDLSGCKTMIYLDDVQDPGNVGTIIRIADWYGVAAVVRSQGSADFYAPKVVQSTMGSMAGPLLVTMDQEAWLNTNKNTIITSVLQGEQILDLPKDRGVSLVVGNEGNGASDLLIQGADIKYTITGASNRKAESLNASVATAILSDRLFR